MENCIELVQDFGGVILGGMITLVASYIAQKQNFKYQQQQSALQQKIDFFDELLSKLPVQTFLPKIDKLKKSDILPELFTEKATELSCLAVRSSLFAGKDVFDKINELMDIVAKGYMMNNVIDDDEAAQCIIAMGFLQSYQNKVNEIVSAVKKEIQEFSVVSLHSKKQAKKQKK